MPIEVLILISTSPPDIFRFCYNNDGDYNMYVWTKFGWKQDKTWDDKSAISREELEEFMAQGKVYELYTA